MMTDDPYADPKSYTKAPAAWTCSYLILREFLPAPIISSNYETEG